MRTLTRRAAMAAGAVGTAWPARAQARELRISHGYSTGYLPLMVMRDQSLIERHAEKAGIAVPQIAWQITDGGNNINDAMLAGSLDIAATGIPGYLVLRDRTLGRRQELVGICALSSGALWLNTIVPRLQTLADYGPGDRIALPGIKTSFAAIVLQMAVAKQFGIENYARLDSLTVGMPHPDAYAAMMSGRTEITSHFASPPFSYQELKSPAVHRVMNTADAVGNLSILMVMTQRAFAAANPGLMQAFVDAQDEANAIIAADKEAAAVTYRRVSRLNVPHDQLMEVLTGGEEGFSTTPNGSLQYATFLTQGGIVRSKVVSWKDMFLPGLHARDGS